MPLVGLTLFASTTFCMNSSGLISLVTAVCLDKIKTVLLSSPFKVFLRFWHCNFFSLRDERRRRRYCGCLQTCKSLLLICLFNCSSVWGIDGYRWYFTLIRTNDYPSSFASVGFTFLPIFFIFGIAYSSEKHTWKALNSITILFPST